MCTNLLKSQEDAVSKTLSPNGLVLAQAQKYMEARRQIISKILRWF